MHWCNRRPRVSFTRGFTLTRRKPMRCSKKRKKDCYSVSIDHLYAFLSVRDIRYWIVFQKPVRSSLGLSVMMWYDVTTVNTFSSAIYLFFFRQNMLLDLRDGPLTAPGSLVWLWARITVSAEFYMFSVCTWTSSGLPPGFHMGFLTLFMLVGGLAPLNCP